jgi:hypothetical protein
MVSGFRRGTDEICALLGYYTASSGNPLPMFRDNVSVPSSSVKKSKKKRTSWHLKMGTTRCPEKSIKDYHSTLLNTPQECRSHITPNFSGVNTSHSTRQKYKKLLTQFYRIILSRYSNGWKFLLDFSWARMTSRPVLKSAFRIFHFSTNSHICYCPVLLTSSKSILTLGKFDVLVVAVV